MITINKAEVEDVEEIRELLRVTWKDAYSEIYSAEAIDIIRADWHSIKLITKQISDSDSLFLVAKDDDKIVAISNTGSITDNVVNVQRLHVLPSHQRKGLGTKLINKIIKTLPNVHIIQLEVEQRSLRAQAFYKKLGFKEVGSKSFVVANVTIPCFILEKNVNLI